MEMTITSWTALQLTGSPWLVGMVAVARTAALPVSGPIRGALSDRVDRLRMIRYSGWVNVIVMGAATHGLKMQRFIATVPIKVAMDAPCTVILVKQALPFEQLRDDDQDPD
jgi:nucleotide-binding universal stress UspA family protein